MEHVREGTVKWEVLADLIVGFGVAENQLVNHIGQEERQIHRLDVVFLVDMAVTKLLMKKL